MKINFLYNLCLKQKENYLCLWYDIKLPQDSFIFNQSETTACINFTLHCTQSYMQVGMVTQLWGRKTVLGCDYHNPEIHCFFMFIVVFFILSLILKTHVLFSIYFSSLSSHDECTLISKILMASWLAKKNKPMKN